MSQVLQSSSHKKRGREKEPSWQDLASESIKSGNVGALQDIVEHLVDLQKQTRIRLHDLVNGWKGGGNDPDKISVIMKLNNQTQESKDHHNKWIIYAEFNARSTTRRVKFYITIENHIYRDDQTIRIKIFHQSKDEPFILFKHIVIPSERPKTKHSERNIKYFLKRAGYGSINSNWPD